MNPEDFFDLLKKKEELDPDLIPWVQSLSGGMKLLNHPLVQDFVYSFHQCAMINKRYQMKLEALEKASKERNINRYVFLHERPYRVDAFLKYNEIYGAYPAPYWETVADIWIDSENIWQNKDKWKKIWLTWDKYRFAHVMNAEEKNKFVELEAKKTFSVYRGYTSETGWKNGYSWTTDWEKAKWFAKRLRQKNEDAMVAHAKITAKSVKAYFNRRNEEEVVIIPAPRKIETYIIMARE